MGGEEADRAVRAAEGRLCARPNASQPAAAPTGLQALGLSVGRDGVFYVPAAYRPERAAALAVLLHGATRDGRGLLERWIGEADRTGAILLAPDSRLRTWDVLHGGYGPDVLFLDRALALIFSRYAVDPFKVAIEGFSDGASYAISLGVANGDLFTHVIANSPGFAAPPSRTGRPRFYLSHGKDDEVLPVDRCSRQLAPELLQAGYDVHYEEFDGGHRLLPEIMQRSFDWWLAPAARAS